MFQGLVCWLCLVILAGSVAGADIPYVFNESPSSTSGFSPDQLEDFAFSSPELNGVPAMSELSDNEVIEISETAGGSGAANTIKRTAAELKKIFDARVDYDNDDVRLKALVITSNFSGDRTIDQMCAIYDYMKKGGGSIKEWSYKSDPREGDLYQYANFTLKAGAAGSCVGMGDCDDFAILMAALIESIGGTSRIVLAYSKTEGHAYAEIYLGKLDDPDSQVQPIIEWLKQEYNTTKIFTHIETTTKEVWLNMDWGPEDRSGVKLFHLGGPFFHGNKHIVLRIREKARKTFLRVPEGYKKPTISKAKEDLSAAQKNQALQSSPSDILGSIPQGDRLPDGFELIYTVNDELNDTSKNIFRKNMTDEIEMFYGEKQIGEVKAAVARYLQPGFDKDGKVTFISSQDPRLAQAAVSNYVSNFQKENPGNVSLIGEARVGDHDATEFKDITGDNAIRYAYLWRSGNLVVLVEGSPDMNKSIAFAEAVKI